MFTEKWTDVSRSESATKIVSRDEFLGTRESIAENHSMNDRSLPASLWQHGVYTEGVKYKGPVLPIG